MARMVVGEGRDEKAINMMMMITSVSLLLNTLPYFINYYYYLSPSSEEVGKN